MERTRRGSRDGVCGRQPDRLGGGERLEGRCLLAAMPVAPAPTDMASVQWEGRVAEVRVDHWVGQLAVTPPDGGGQGAPPVGGTVLDGPLALSHPGWQASPLGHGFFALVTPGAGRAEVLDWAASTAAVARLEPDLVVRAAAVPNDPLLPSQWSLVNTGQYAGTVGADINAAQAWSLSTGSRTVVVAVIDSGLDITHPDLAANIWTNPGDASGNAVDDDANGFVDDVHGWNFVDGNSDVSDGYGHGTHVAGIIGAVGNNGIGVTGVTWQVALLPLKIQDSFGVGYTSSIIKAINYVTMMRRDHGVLIVAANASWQSAAGYSVVVQEAIRAEGEAGVVFVAAAGNNASDNDVIPRYPANYDLPNVISVAALSTTDALASLSNYGATTVDLAAPGSLIQSTFPGGTYGILSGTSMAAPHVTGTAALLAAARPGITAAEIRFAILGSTTPVAGLAGKVATGGRLNAAAALVAAGVVMPVPGPSPMPAPVPPPPPAPVPTALPFADGFNQPAGPLSQTSWVQTAGRIAISANTAISTVAGNSIMAVRGLAVADVRLRAVVTTRAIVGQAVGLVARYGGTGDTNMYLGRLVRRPAGFVAQIWRNVGGEWRLLGARLAPRGSGVLQFDVVGSTLRLSFNQRLLVAVRDTAIVRPGGVGVRISGVGNRIDDFLAA